MTNKQKKQDKLDEKLAYLPDEYGDYQINYVAPLYEGCAAFKVLYAFVDTSENDIDATMFNNSFKELPLSSSCNMCGCSDQAELFRLWESAVQSLVRQYSPLFTKKGIYPFYQRQRITIGKLASPGAIVFCITKKINEISYAVCSTWALGLNPSILDPDYNPLMYAMSSKRSISVDTVDDNSSKNNSLREEVKRIKEKYNEQVKVYEKRVKTKGVMGMLGFSKPECTPAEAQRAFETTMNHFCREMVNYPIKINFGDFHFTEKSITSKFAKGKDLLLYFEVNLKSLRSDKLSQILNALPYLADTITPRPESLRGLPATDPPPVPAINAPVDFIPESSAPTPPGTANAPSIESMLERESVAVDLQDGANVEEEEETRRMMSSVQRANNTNNYKGNENVKMANWA